MTEEKKGMLPINKADFAKLAVFLFLLLILVFLIFMVYLKMQRYDFTDKSAGDVIVTLLTGNNKSTDRKVSEISFDAKDTVVFGRSGEYILQCRKESVQGLGLDGLIKWEDTVALTHPMVKSAGDFALIWDQGGKDLIVYQGKVKKWQVKSQGNLVNAQINEKGLVAAFHESEQYKSAVTAYDARGNEMFTRAKGENYMIGGSISPQGDRLVVNLIDTSDVYANTIFEFFDLSKISDRAVTSIKKENALFPSTWYVSNGAILFVGDQSAIYANSDMEEKWEKKFTGKVFSSNVASGKYPVVGVRDGGKNTIDSMETRVIIYKSDGKEYGSYKMEGEIKNISVFGSQIAVNTGRELHFIDSRGKMQFTYALKKDILDVYFLYGEKAAVLTRDKLVVIRTN